jgi:hypothetical protein
MTLHTLAASLLKIEERLLILNRGALLRRLQPGLAPGVVKSELASCGLPSSKAVATLYAWKNGTDVTDSKLGEIYFVPGFYLLSLEDAITNYRVLADDERWTAGWLPLLADGGGDFYVIDLSQRSFGEIRHFRVDEVEHPVEFESLEAMMGTIARGYERGVLYVDKGGYLEIDRTGFAELAAGMNPSIAWWTA